MLAHCSMFEESPDHNLEVADRAANPQHKTRGKRSLPTPALGGPLKKIRKAASSASKAKAKAKAKGNKTEDGSSQADFAEEDDAEEDDDEEQDSGLEE